MPTHWIPLGPPPQELEASQWTAELCPKSPQTEAKSLPKPSLWAKEAFHFTPNKIQQTVLDANSKRLILCCNRQWGKSTVIALKALHHALEHPKSVIVVVSRTEKQGGELLARALDFASLLKIPKRRVPGYIHSLLLPNEAKIYAISHSTQTAPSRTADILIFDEAAVVADAVFSVTLPFVARTGGAVWMLSTPRGQLGFFYNFWHDKDPQWTRIFSTVDDCPEIPREFVELHRRGAPHLFRQEFYCEFTPAPGSLISRDRLQSMYDPALNDRTLPPLPTRR